MNPAGAIWQKWDLHIHTPASFHWNGKKLYEHTQLEQDELCKELLDRVNAIDVCAFCIMDYWTFDGYLAIRAYLEIRYNLRLGGKDISQLSPGEKGALLLVFYLLLDTEEIPIIIDQPEHNLDNESVVRLLVDCIRKARARRQVMIVTHNPNLAVYCDADQIICCSIDKTHGQKIDYSTGAIEDYDINAFAVNVLEGTYPAFDNRRKKWHKPLRSLSVPNPTTAPDATNLAEP